MFIAFRLISKIYFPNSNCRATFLVWQAYKKPNIEKTPYPLGP